MLEGIAGVRDLGTARSVTQLKPSTDYADSVLRNLRMALFIRGLADCFKDLDLAPGERASV